LVKGAGLAAMEVGGEKTDEDRRERGVIDLGDEVGNVDAVESLCEVECDNNGAEGRFAIVETVGYMVSEFQKGGGGGLAS
jgi:hypothetical protein